MTQRPIPSYRRGQLYCILVYKSSLLSEGGAGRPTLSPPFGTASIRGRHSAAIPPATSIAWGNRQPSPLNGNGPGPCFVWIWLGYRFFFAEPVALEIPKAS